MSFALNPYRHPVVPTFGNASRSLDGVNDRIDISGLPVGAGDYSLSAWIKVSNFGPIDVIISAINPPNQSVWGPALRFDEVSPYNKFAFFAGGSVGPAGILYSSTISSSVWVHVVATADIGQSAKIYIDGAEDVTGPNPTAFTNHNGNWSIGTEYAGIYGRYFDGLIAEVRIYNKALTSSEVLDLYNGTHVSDGLVGWWLTDNDDVLDYSGNGNHGTNSGSTYSIIGPKDYLMLDLDAGDPASYSGTGVNWSDLSEYGNDGTLVNGVGYSSDGGGSLAFDGVDDWIDIPNSSLPIADYTINFWVKTPGSLSGYRHIISTSQYYWYLGTYNNQFTIDIVNGIFRFGTINVNTWYNVAVSRSGDINTAYINAVNEGTHSNATLLTGRWEIGRWAPDPGYPGYWNSNIAKVQIYNRALTSQEIQQNFELYRGRFGI